MYLEPHDYQIYYVNIDLRHEYGISAPQVADVPPRETSPVAESKEKRMFSQATMSLVPFVTLSVLRVENNFVIELVHEEENFQNIPE